MHLEHNCKDPIVIKNATELLYRSEVWYKKYWTTLEDNNLPLDQRLQHAIEEWLDMVNYLRTIQFKLRENTSTVSE